MKRSIIRKVAKSATKSPRVNIKVGSSPDKIQSKLGTYTKSNKFSSMTGKRTIDGMTRRQAYRLERGLQDLNRMAISTKPATIKALGQALALNTSGAQGGLAMGIAEKMKAPSSQPSVTNSINNLIGGGADIADKDNDEESMDTSEPDDFSFLR